MAQSKQEIINDIKNHIGQDGGAYRAWYVGIARDARDRLFNGHGVHQRADAWIYRQASSSDAARDVEDYLVNTLGTDGGPGGGDSSTDMVYAYKKSPRTNP
jgi:hypothetical protein